MRITNEQLQQIYAGMTKIAWTELGRLHRRHPLAAAIHASAGPTLIELGLAEFAGRQNSEHIITDLGEAIWETHQPETHHRRGR
ncbi:MAG: hypothetical protein GY838_13185 [bacterium]|nr:hypothetical protein [bacterium]